MPYSSRKLGPWSDAGDNVRVWLPNTVDNRAAVPSEDYYPWPRVTGKEIPNFKALLVIVTGKQGLLAADSAKKEGVDVVIWAWGCPEVTTVSAEDHFPVVVGYHGTNKENVLAARARGPRRTPESELCWKLEEAYGFEDY